MVPYVCVYIYMYILYINQIIKLLFPFTVITGATDGLGKAYAEAVSMICKKW